MDRNYSSRKRGVRRRSQRKDFRAAYPPEPLQDCVRIFTNKAHAAKILNMCDDGDEACEVMDVQS